MANTRTKAWGCGFALGFFLVKCFGAIHAKNFRPAKSTRGSAQQSRLFCCRSRQFFVGCLIFRFFTEHNQRLASVSRTRFLGSMPRAFRLSSDDSASSIPGTELDRTFTG